MLTFLKYAAAAVIAYFVGNVSTGIIIGKLFGNIDIRTKGSGNAGANNVMRTLGYLPFALTLIGDALKAVVAILLGRWIGGNIGGCVAAIAALLGHNWPVLYNFKGGKGMSSSLGIVLMFDPLMALILVLIQAALLISTGYMSVASITTAILLPVLTAIFGRGDTAYLVVTILMGVLALFCHRSNIKRLIEKKENKLDFKKIGSKKK